MTYLIHKIDDNYNNDLISSHVLHPEQDYGSDNNRDNDFLKKLNLLDFMEGHSRLIVKTCPVICTSLISIAKLIMDIKDVKA